MRKKKEHLVSRMFAGKRIYGQGNLRKLIVLSSIISKTSFNMDETVQNFKIGVVSSVIDLSDF